MVAWCTEAKGAVLPALRDGYPVTVREAVRPSPDQPADYEQSMLVGVWRLISRRQRLSDDPLIQERFPVCRQRGASADKLA
jgi:hypothetical protein